MPKPRTKGLAKPGDVKGLAAIRFWSNQLENAMISRYIGNAPTLKPIYRILKSATKKVQSIKPRSRSDCSPYQHLDSCECVPEF